MPQRTIFFTDEFQQQIKRLSKRFRSIKDDVEPTIRQLAEGETPGDRLQGINHLVFKVRLPNRDARRGKRGVIGCCTIYQPLNGLSCSQFTAKQMFQA